MYYGSGPKLEFKYSYEYKMDRTLTGTCVSINMGRFMHEEMMSCQSNGMMVMDLHESTRVCHE